jgi:hypothetical protein
MEGDTFETRSWLPSMPRSPLNLRPFTRTKLAIVGASALTDDEPPPLSDPQWDVWGCNSLWRRHLDANGLFRADVWWEMHPISAQTEQELLDMHECPVPLYVLNENGRSLDCPHWMAYPLDQMREEFGDRDYYTNTFAYQVALAITQGYQEIGLWGVELWQGSTREARVELPCLNYWLGIAKGKGIIITLPDYSKLLWHEHLYGYDYSDDVAQSATDDRDVAVKWCQEEAKRRKKQDGEEVSMRSLLS